MAALRTTFNWDRMGWTEKLDLWWNAEGASARVIAERLGISRGAVLGKVHRMGWSGTVQNPQRRGKPGPAKKKPSTTRRKLVGATSPRRQPGINDLATTPHDVSYEAAVPLTDLTAKHCRWPVSGEGSTRYCGHAKSDPAHSYCTHHMERAYIRHPDVEGTAKC